MARGIMRIGMIPGGRCILRIEYLPLMGGPVVSSDRPGLGFVFVLRGGIARASFGMYTAAGGATKWTDDRSYGFDMEGFVCILTNMALGLVGGPNTKRAPKLGYRITRNRRQNQLEYA